MLLKLTALVVSVKCRKKGEDFSHDFESRGQSVHIIYALG